jgi:N-acetylglucosamine-6-phosphate deacetylase
MAGYVDLQVNGYAGVDFNADALSPQRMLAACDRLRADGNASVLATVITAPLPLMMARIGRIADFIEQLPEVASIIRGIHVEGPFINPSEGYVGAHPPAAAIRATQDTAQRLLDSGRGHVRLLTLAPEQDEGGKVTGWLTDAGVIVAAGHSNASLDELRRGIDQGVKLFTHLGNGCPGLLPRHDNIIQRVLSLSDRMMISFIADGHHVPAVALRNYMRCVPHDRIVIVTDAISAAGLGPGRYELSGQVIEVDAAGAAWSASRQHFAGSAATFPQMIDFLSRHVGATSGDITQWMSGNPSRLLGL